MLGYVGIGGSGKTFSMTSDVDSNFKKAKRYWRKYNKPFWNKPLDLIPYFKKKRINNEMYGLDKPRVYSTYPILLGCKSDIKKYNSDVPLLIEKGILSTPLDNDIMFLRKSIPLQSQIVMDEVSSWINQYSFKEKYSNKLNEHLQKFRHFHGNFSHFYVADQCSNLIVNQIRYRLNKLCSCTKTRHYFWFIHVTWYKEITITDDIKNVEIISKDDADTDDNTLRIIRFGLTRRYDDRAYSNKYWFVDRNPKHSKYINSIFKTNNSLVSPSPDDDYTPLDDIIAQWSKEFNKGDTPYKLDSNCKKIEPTEKVNEKEEEKS